MRSLLILGVFVLLSVNAPAQAGDDPLAEWANCHICKVMLPHMAELMPVIKHELVTLDNGCATLTTVTDPAKLESYHQMCKAMHKAGEESASFTKEEASAQLCPMCQKMWVLMADGAHLSYGLTSRGDMLVLSSEDPEIQARIVALWKEYEQMMPGS